MDATKPDNTPLKRELIGLLTVGTGLLMLVKIFFYSVIVVKLTILDMALEGSQAITPVMIILFFLDLAIYGIHTGLRNFFEELIHIGEER